MSRLLPRTIGGQLIVLLFAALVVSQAVALVFVSGERYHVARVALREESLARLASVVQLLQQIPPELHERVLAAASSPGLSFWVGDESAVVAQPLGVAEQDLADQLAAMLGDAAAGPARVRLVDRDDPFIPWPWHGDRTSTAVGWPLRDRDADDDDDDERDDHVLQRPVSLVLSVPLSDGTWLNMQSLVRPPPNRWEWPRLASLLVMALAILVIVALTVRRITRPLRALARAADRLGRGEAVQPLLETGPAEVRRTTAAFNAMQLRLDRFVQDRMRLLAAISHDLRTPITALRLRAELVDDEETRRKLLETLEEMQRLTEATLEFAREEAATEETRPVDLAALVASIADDMAELGHAVTFTEAARLPYPCRPVSLRRAIRNLLENAVRYGHRAHIALVATADGPHITIDDDGPGIPPDRLEHVFEPFVRLDESRSQATGGIGLGLAIARSAVRAHGGDVTLTNRTEGGLRATIRLPAAVA